MQEDNQSHLDPPGEESTAPPEPAVEPSDKKDGVPENAPTPAVESTESTDVEGEASPETAPDAESGPERSALQKIGDSFRARAERFMTMLRGERLPEEDAEKESSIADKAKFGAKIGISVMATLGGYKGAWDAPAWFYQKFFTNPAERKRIKAELGKNVETEKGEGKPSAVELKRTQIEAAVQSSKFLSPEKKTELTEKLNEIMAERDGELEKLDETRNQAIAELLDEFITTRVKGTVALKEGVNTALHAAADATGLGLGMRMARSGTYGVVSLYERWNTVSKEREVDSEGNAKRTGSQMKEFMNGFKETKEKLLLQGEGNKFKNFAQASATVARFVGMTFIGVEAGAQSDAGKEALDKMLDNFANIVPSAEAHGLDDVPKAIPEDTGGVTETLDPAKADLSDTGVEDPDTFVGPLPEDAEFVGPLPEDAEFTGPIEFDPQQIELGTVKTGDGILKVLERQMEASPQDFGYEGDLEDAKAVDAWAKSASMEAARESGLVRAAGDTRLATGAIDKLSVMAKVNSDGGINIVFLDNETGDHMNLDQIREQGLTYEHGDGPGVADTEPASLSGEATVETLEELRAPEVEVDAPAAVESDGSLEGNHEAAMDIIPVEASAPVEAAPVVEASSVAPTGPEVAPLAGGAAPEAPEVRDELAAGLEKAAFGNTKFDLPGEGEVRFSYNQDGTVKNVFVPGKWVTDQSLMKDALSEQGLTSRGVTEQFAQKDAGISGHVDGMPVDRDPAPLSGGGVSHEARDQAREFIRKTTRLYVERQALDEMYDAGLSGTPEYAALKDDIEGIEKIMEKEYR